MMHPALGTTASVHALAISAAATLACAANVSVAQINPLELGNEGIGKAGRGYVVHRESQSPAHHAYSSRSSACHSCDRDVTAQCALCGSHG